ncbi:hypothetical protein M446_4080 [Methylobacterium sp. 4-46]|uniref:hypothetical protein n=1 Tax=unclassified Methylobacterium TaxID=2615210 RepID=UPI000152E466|nr:MULTISPECIES: hypothetical protein [Methylobacterium]ACA18438.1 hypothetical protein M446_4080 [Methylobacterium sp. 4-46]WFT77730.1 hypothetical protein QA634_20740 [Methylobacterium nodulans]
MLTRPQPDLIAIHGRALTSRERVAPCHLDEPAYLRTLRERLTEWPEDDEPANDPLPVARERDWLRMALLVLAIAMLILFVAASGLRAGRIDGGVL